MDEDPEKPKHGAERNRHMKTIPGKLVEYLDSQGDVVYSGPLSSVTRSACERYCAHCDKWIPLEGVLGPITFMVEHDHKEEHETTSAV